MIKHTLRMLKLCEITQLRQKYIVKLWVIGCGLGSIPVVEDVTLCEP